MKAGGLHRCEAGGEYEYGGMAWDSRSGEDLPGGRGMPKTFVVLLITGGPSNVSTSKHRCTRGFPPSSTRDESGSPTIPRVVAPVAL